MDTIAIILSILGLAGCLYVLFSILVKAVSRQVSKEISKEIK